MREFVSIELKQQLTAIAEAVAGGHAGLSGAVIEALNRAAAQLRKQKDKPDDLAARLGDHARALGRPGESFSIDALASDLREAADRV
jgi:ABC-type transporter Mla subunit MlaD